MLQARVRLAPDSERAAEAFPLSPDGEFGAVPLLDEHFDADGSDMPSCLRFAVESSALCGAWTLVEDGE